MLHNNTVIDGSIEEWEINYQSKMISKMQCILERCKELEINFFNAKDAQIKIEGLLIAMNALFDVFDKDRKITKMKQKTNKILSQRVVVGVNEITIREYNLEKSDKISYEKQLSSFFNDAANLLLITGDEKYQPILDKCILIQNSYVIQECQLSKTMVKEYNDAPKSLNLFEKAFRDLNNQSTKLKTDILDDFGCKTAAALNKRKNVFDNH